MQSTVDFTIPNAEFLVTVHGRGKPLRVLPDWNKSSVRVGTINYARTIPHALLTGCIVRSLP